MPLTVDVPADDVHHAVEHAASDLARSVRIPGFRRRLLRPGVLLQVFAVRRGQIGKYTSFRIRRGHAPRRSDSCARPGAASVVPCG